MVLAPNRYCPTSVVPEARYGLGVGPDRCESSSVPCYGRRGTDIGVSHSYVSVQTKAYRKATHRRITWLLLGTKTGVSHSNFS
eukprot:2919928-Rhodomonas_salina.1